MKALLRSSILALVVFAGFAAASSRVATSIPGLPSPMPCPGVVK